MRRGSGLIVALVASLVAFSALAQAPVKNVDGKGVSAKTQEASAFEVKEAPYSAYPRMLDEKCYEEKNHDTADLCAQWRSALAAEQNVDLLKSANKVSLIGAVLSLVSTVLVLIALWQGREAHKLAADTSKRQLRAYVVVKSCQVFKPSSVGDFPFRVQIVFENTGATPAHDVNSHVRLVLSEGSDSDVELPALPTLAFASQNPIGSQHTSDNVVGFTPEQSHNDIMSKIVEGAACCHCYGYLRYKDVYGDPQHYVFRLYLNNQSRFEHGKFMIGTGNQMT
jgi:hypothetical protein